MNECKTLEQQIIELWKSRGMEVEIIRVTYPTWTITIKKTDKES